MAWNAAAPYTGALQYFDDSGTALGDVQGGELVIDPNTQIEGAIGGQASAQGGMIGITARLDLLEPVVTYLTGMPRATASTQSTAYDFECGTTDGDYNLTRVQPAGLSYEVSQDRPIPRCTLEYMAALIAEGSTGSAQAASAGLTDCMSDFDVAIDGSDYGCQRFAIRLTNNPRPYRTLDAKSTNAKRFPDAILLGPDQWSVTLDLAKKLPVASSSIIADEIDTDIDVVITGKGVVFTLSDLCSGRERGPFQGDSGLVIWTYELQSLPGFGKGQISAL